jgi:hypothetical protein
MATWMRAVFEYDGGRRWLRTAPADLVAPLAVEVRVFDTAMRQVLLVHRRRRARMVADVRGGERASS